ncbi:hypothetical protein V8C86DRAFT_2884581 [Haematococcus lacustris]
MWLRHSAYQTTKLRRSAFERNQGFCRRESARWAVRRSGQTPSDEDAKALQEAVQLYKQAGELSRLQTLAGLEAEWASTSPPLPRPTLGHEDWEWPANAAATPRPQGTPQPRATSSRLAPHPAKPTPSSSSSSSSSPLPSSNLPPKPPKPQPWARSALPPSPPSQPPPSPPPRPLPASLSFPPTATSPATPAAVTALLVEQGLSSFEAMELTTQLQGASSGGGGTGSGWTLAQLAAKLQRWQRVLPGIPVARLLQRDPDLLTADLNTGLQALITLVNLLPGRDVTSMVSQLPRLLWLTDLEQQLAQSLALLTRLHPSQDPEVVKDMVVEYPQLVQRMAYYQHARMLDELPLEIQNMMVVADQGIGYTYRYYKNRRTGYKAELSSREPFEQQT